MKSGNKKMDSEEDEEEFGLLALFDTVSPSGGWILKDGKWVNGLGRGESYGLGMMYSQDGGYWSQGVDVELPGGCRTPLGFILEEEDERNENQSKVKGSATSFPPSLSGVVFYTKRYADCSYQVLPPGSRGDAANDPTMC